MTTGRSRRGLQLLIDTQRAEAAYWRRHQTNPSARTRTDLFLHYHDFARRTALKEHQRISGKGLDLTDCLQIAYEAMISTIERYNPNRGVPFSAFARPRLVGAIRNALVKATEAQAAYAARNRAERDRMASLKSHASLSEGDDAMDTLRQLVVGMALGFMLEEGADEQLENVPCDTPSAFDSAAWNQFSKALNTKLSSLPQKERRVIELHYQQGLPFAQIATLLGLSRGRISQIHAQGLARLRKSLAKFR